jgi:ADP-ribose pyrophosphatase
MVTEKKLQPWILLDQTELYRLGTRLRVMGDHIRLPDGREIRDYLRLAMPDYVAILALDAEGRIVCERQYKHGVGRVVLTLPAGALEEGEAPQAAAERELLEETGHAAACWQRLFSAATHGNAGGPAATAFLATDCRKVAEPDSGDLEEMVVETLTPQEVLAALDRGEFALMTDRAVILHGLKRLGLLR